MAAKENWDQNSDERTHRQKKPSRRKRQQREFVLDCINEQESRLPFYKANQDKYMQYFFIRTLKSKRKRSRSPKKSTGCKPVWSCQPYLGPKSRSQDRLEPTVATHSKSPTKEQFDGFILAKKSEILLRRY